ncbi:MAG: type II toxin-antitoxin system VapC family toxin [Symploca sp. SIO1C2]|nr:type II toxin-antitoxin system VapC family toxin [Symploca sp. SIO1C2]
MRYLIDTNVLLRSIQFGHPMQPQSQTALEHLLQDADQVCLASQNLIEFWNVCTRPLDKNGLGMSVQETYAELIRLEGIFSILPDTPYIYPQWKQLVEEHEVKGVNVHDAKLVAVMLVNGISHILTFNTEDFRRFSHITVVNPSEITTEYS